MKTTTKTTATATCKACLGSGWNLAGVPEHLKSSEIALQYARMVSGHARPYAACPCCKRPSLCAVTIPAPADEGAA